MKRKRGGLKIGSKEEAMEELVNPICGLKNASHTHCHILSVLHLLAQTGLHLPKDTSLHSLHHISQFFDQYSKGSTFFPHQIIHNPTSFGVKRFPDRPADLIHLFINFFSQETAAVAFKTFLEWRFECVACKRLTRTKMHETVVRIDATEPASFEQLLDRFFSMRKCICGALCTSQPLPTSTSGDFLFIDIDRSSSSKGSSSPDSGEEEISLFPLRLEVRRPGYKILGSTYKVFATVNLNLDYAEGGHYSTNLFVGEEDELLCVHEEDFDLHHVLPSFDSTAIVVALRKEADEEKEGPSLSKSPSSSLFGYLGETGPSLSPSSPFCNFGQGSPIFPFIQMKLKKKNISVLLSRRLS